MLRTKDRFRSWLLPERTHDSNQAAAWGYRAAAQGSGEVPETPLGVRSLGAEGRGPRAEGRRAEPLEVRSFELGGGVEPKETDFESEKVPCEEKLPIDLRACLPCSAPYVGNVAAAAANNQGMLFY